MKFSDYKLFIFDMGNVVVKNITVLKQTAALLNLELEEFWQDYETYEFPLMDGEIPMSVYYEHVEKVFQVKVPGNPFGEFFNPVPNESILSVIDKLRSLGKTVVCGTNTFDVHWDKLMASGLPQKLFDNIYASHIMHVSKPRARFYQMILENEKVAPEQAFFVDDLERNIIAARKLGIEGLVYNNDSLLLKTFEMK